MNTISPSHLYREAAGVARKGTMKMPHDGFCAQCAVPITAGDLVTPTSAWVSRERFNNKLDLGAPESRHVCADCGALYHKDYLQKYSKSYACCQGVFRLASNADQCWLLLNPPEPPFIAILSDIQQQHLIWRAPVNWNRDLIKVRMGDRILRVRRKVLMQAVDAVARSRNRMEAAGVIGKHPFQGLDRELASVHGTAIRHDVRRIAVNDRLLAADLVFLESLSMGELWGLTLLIFTDPTTVRQPIRLLPADLAHAA